METFTHYTDPAHGWVEVPRALLHELGIADKITGYSYQRGEDVFLEEDCDLSVFARAMEKAGRSFDLIEVNEPRGKAGSGCFGPMSARCKHEKVQR
jgi:hypothetical protein